MHLAALDLKSSVSLLIIAGLSWVTSLVILACNWLGWQGEGCTPWTWSSPRGRSQWGRGREIEAATPHFWSDSQDRNNKLDSHDVTSFTSFRVNIKWKCYTLDLMDITIICQNSYWISHQYLSCICHSRFPLNSVFFETPCIIVCNIFVLMCFEK